MHQLLRRRSRRARRFAVPLLGMALFLVPVGEASAQADRFTCEATALSITSPIFSDEFIVANPGGDPCRDDFQQLLGVGDETTPVAVGVLTAQTEVEDDNNPETQDFARSQAEVVGARVSVIPNTPITASVLGSSAQATCPEGGGEPQFSGNSHIAQVTIGSTVIPVAAPPNTVIPTENPLLFVVVNEQFMSGPDQFTVRALRVTSPTLGVNIIFAESVVDFHGNPCRDRGAQRFPGWMTGGGFVAEPGSRQDKNGEGTVEPGQIEHHSFSIDCFFPTGDDPGKKDHLNVRWTDDSGAERGRFRLVALMDARCTNETTERPPEQPRSRFNTISGEGVGFCKQGNTEVPAMVEFRFTDEGEPGRFDEAEIHVSSPAEPAPILCNLDSEGNLDGGNHQAHQTRRQFNTPPSNGRQSRRADLRQLRNAYQMLLAR